MMSWGKELRFSVSIGRLGGDEGPRKISEILTLGERRKKKIIHTCHWKGRRKGEERVTKGKGGNAN